jgi:hypothetical protein
LASFLKIAPCGFTDHFTEENTEPLYREIKYLLDNYPETFMTTIESKIFFTLAEYSKEKSLFTPNDTEHQLLFNQLTEFLKVSKSDLTDKTSKYSKEVLSILKGTDSCYSFNSKTAPVTTNAYNYLTAFANAHDEAVKQLADIYGQLKNIAPKNKNRNFHISQCSGRLMPYNETLFNVVISASYHKKREVAANINRIVMSCKENSKTWG